MQRDRPPTATGSSRSASISLAALAAPAGSATWSRKTPNSSPPRRATVAEPPRPSARRPAPPLEVGDHGPGRQPDDGGDAQAEGQPGDRRSRGPRGGVPEGLADHLRSSEEADAAERSPDLVAQRRLERQDEQQRPHRGV